MVWYGGTGSEARSYVLGPNFFLIFSSVTDHFTSDKRRDGFRFERDSTRGALRCVWLAFVYVCVLGGGGVKPVLYCQKWSRQ